MSIKKIYKLLPRWSLGVFIVDAVFFFLMRWLGKSWCGGASTCYRLTIGTDRFADYFALIVAVMAILIPVAIELWKKQFVARNLSPKSPLDSVWAEEDRMRYLYEPVASMAIFVTITALLPLVISSSALFYAGIAYGIFLLVYVFYVSFFKKPLDIYELSVLNPPDNGLPPRETMSELATITLEATTDTPQTNSPSSSLTWVVQLSEAKTLEKLVTWIQTTLKRHLKGDFNKMSLWSIFTNFITKCSVDTLWLPSYDEHGPIRTLFADKKFYQYGNLVHAAQILKTITDRFADTDSYYETIGTLLSTIPTNDIDEEDLVRLFDATFRILFLKSGDNDLVLRDTFPDEWRVTTKNVKDKMPKVTTAIYLQWIWNLQMQSDNIPEPAVQEVTQIIFPEVEPMLFAKFVLLRLNMVRLGGDSMEQSATVLDEAIRKWHVFGHVGRVTAEWEPAGAEDSLENKWRQDFAASEAATLKLVKELGWFAWDKKNVYMLTQMLRGMIRATGWPKPLQNSWLNFIDVLAKLFDDDEQTDTTA